MIVFFEVRSGERVGAVWLEDGALKCDPPMRSMVDAWVINRRLSPESFMAEHARWGNGYLESLLMKG